ncbi:hypothetical protein [Thermococcus thioreducens]|uniref:Uncharacterized protein n=1 Tax=Thermococcus thioreducens TaxID=277988 RepID=A0A0Q2M1F0_9EURY|nr:hypothetical protein [Thermococcus thioreducens]ASJ11899.1 hypothetical protein A3L14_02910 [Thermococcus thioreducens]KQH81690.1 hypothetical protein AMR53_09860 [Thermococcus thioreducens]
MNRHSVLLTFLGDLFIIIFLGAVIGAIIYAAGSWFEIQNEYCDAVFSSIITLMGMSVFRRGTLSILDLKLASIITYPMVAIIPIMFILGHWIAGGIVVGFLGGYLETQRKISNGQMPVK